MDADYLIIGQGISGTLLSYHLIKAGKRVVVVDKYRANSASRVASGIINPVTGRRVVRSWMIETLLPFAEKTYEDIGEMLGVKTYHKTDMLTFHTTEQMSNAWNDKIAGGDDYLATVSEVEPYKAYFDMVKDVSVTHPCLIVNLEKLLEAWRHLLKQLHSLIETDFSFNNCHISKDEVCFEHVKAKKVILCNGVEGFDNQYFRKLPFAPSKGEVLIVEIKGLPETTIYKQGMSLVPIGGNKFWLGSSFEWDFDDDKPTSDFRKRGEDLLKKWLKLPYEILKHVAAIRPGSLDRRPFIGIHPKESKVGIVNGLGTKGCSLAPYFTYQFAQNLVYGTDIIPDASINRFNRTLMTM